MLVLVGLFGLIAISGLMIAVFILNRSWGGSLDQEPRDRAGSPPSADQVAEIQRLLAAGNPIAAIKLVRGRTGMSLREAKAYVEGLARGAAPSAPPSAVAPATIDDAELRRLVAQGNPIAAIKLVREQTGMGLRDAKVYVEALDARRDG
jgi:ribosomal protein L7/L12